MAGTLAFHWGNSRFERPDFDFDSLVTAIQFHDKAYGELDALPADGLEDDQWVEIQTDRGIIFDFPDQTTNTLILIHIRRQALARGTAACQEFAAGIERMIAGQVEHHSLMRRALDKADRITAFCDSLAHNFCLEGVCSGSELVYPRHGSEAQIGIEYEIGQQGTVMVDPWPFAPDSFGGYLVGYGADAYPAKLDPVIIPYAVKKRRSSHERAA